MYKRFLCCIHTCTYIGGTHRIRVFCSLPLALLAAFAPLPLLAASMADMLMYEHRRSDGILLIPHTHTHTRTYKCFLLVAFVFVCAFCCLFAYFLSVSFRFRLREENRFLWHLSTSLLRDPTKLFQCSFFFYFSTVIFSFFLSISCVVEILIQSFILKHSTSYSISVVSLYTQKGRAAQQTNPKIV